MGTGYGTFTNYALAPGHCEPYHLMLKSFTIIIKSKGENPTNLIFDIGFIYRANIHLSKAGSFSPFFSGCDFYKEWELIIVTLNSSSVCVCILLYTLSTLFHIRFRLWKDYVRTMISRISWRLLLRKSAWGAPRKATRCVRTTARTWPRGSGFAAHPL